MIFTHISARVPGPEHHFLINPYGMLFEEITASSLVKIDIDGNKVGDSPYPVNPAGFTIHSALHMNRDDAHCVIHLHTTDGVAVSAQEDGLLPLDQHAMMIAGDIAYHDYEGIALDLDERERLVHDIGDRSAMILRNHGTLTLGRTCADAFLRMYYLERACSMQVRALAGGVKWNMPNQGVSGKDGDAGQDGVQRHGRRPRLARAAAQARPSGPELQALTVDPAGAAATQVSQFADSASRRDGLPLRGRT